LTIAAATATQIQVGVPTALLADEGTARVAVSNPGPGGGLSLPLTFTVTEAPLTAAGVNLSVHGSKTFSGVVATFTDANPGATTADFTALIIWDNGTASLGTVSSAGGLFIVSGSHTFVSFTNVHVVTVTIFDKGGRTATVTDDVVDPPALGSPHSPLHDQHWHRRLPVWGHHPGHHQPRSHRATGGEARK
jgi:hypothetical protein